MRAFVINLERAKDRWVHIEESFSKTSFQVQRVPAVDGNLLSLPHPHYAEQLYRRYHGRETNRFELACYLSHIEAMKAFLETDDAHGMICEDDIVLKLQLDAVVSSALSYADSWNMLRLTALTTRGALKVTKITPESYLTVFTQRAKGAGAYIVDRKAARHFVASLLPMWLPYDHAVDREWFQGLATASVSPFPISQTDRIFRSSIQGNSTSPVSTLSRLLTTYPYQAFNEVTRWFFRHTYFIYLKVVTRRKTSAALT